MTFRKLTTVAATLALALALGACGDKKDDAASVDPLGTPTADASSSDQPSDPSPSDSPANTNPAAGIKVTTGDAKAAFNTLFKAFGNADAGVLCGFMDMGDLTDVPAGFDCPTIYQQIFSSDLPELKALATIKVDSVTTTGDKACISLKDIKVDVAALAQLVGADGFDTDDDTPMCMSNASGHWVIVE